jgi:leucyl aminopeptidase
LKDYQFSKYKSKNVRIQKKVRLISSKIKKSQIDELLIVIEAVFTARNWVNEPVNKLTTKQFIKDVNVFKNLNINVEVFNESKLKTLNMGGVLGVNQGSNEEPAVIKCEWKPKNAKNKRPVVLVGKGVLFDTGGINIKTGGFMAGMKADMGGAASVLGTLKAVANSKLPIHLITLTPVTENRINGNELVPGDIITMYNGKTVEILNTDAEGRLILADALSFAEKFDPSLVLDVATLTGSAFRVTGHHGAIMMGTDDRMIKKIRLEGDRSYERLIELPMWEEFEETLKSDVADMTNLGSSEGQAVCAGLFLKNFINYPWIHLDIAGSAFRNNQQAYLPKGGTGFGVRLLYNFLKNNFAN